MTPYLEDVKVGDLVVRDMAGLKINLRVSQIVDDVIHCGPWTFSRINGDEIDEDIPTPEGVYISQIHPIKERETNP